MTKLQNILTRFKYDNGLQILDQNFSNEIIFDRKLYKASVAFLYCLLVKLVQTSICV